MHDRPRARIAARCAPARCAWRTAQDVIRGLYLSLTNILGRASVLSAPDKEWLHQLVGDWQTVSDVSFSDLLLAVPNDDSRVAFAAPLPSRHGHHALRRGRRRLRITPDFQKAAWATLTDGIERTVSRSAFGLVLNPVRRGEAIIAVVAVAKAHARNVVPSQGPVGLLGDLPGARPHDGHPGVPFDGRPTVPSPGLPA